MSEADPILDETVLSNLSASVDGDRSFVVELIETFLADGPDQLTAIDAARAEDDAENLVRPAHTLKSSSAVLGAARLSAISRQIEFCGREGRATDMAALAQEAQRAWAATVEALRGAGLSE